ncbi:MAG: putative toxin-antitoxin system toxin component, PIN family, partial [Candidatus Aminicenantes bacterium]
LCLDRFEIIISSYLIDEVKTNLSKKLKLPPELIRDVIEFLSENATLIGVDKAPLDICKDPEDAKLLALAQKSGAPYLITGNKDLLAIKKYASSKILSPRQFWETVKKQDET